MPLTDFAHWLKIGGQGDDDGLESLGIENRDSLGQRPQGGAGATELALDVSELAGLLDASHRVNDEVEEDEQDECAVLVEREASTVGRIAIAADLMKLVKQGHEPVEVLQALDITGFKRFGRPSGHARVSATWRARKDGKLVAQIAFQSNERTSGFMRMRAEHYWNVRSIAILGA